MTEIMQATTIDNLKKTSAKGKKIDLSLKLKNDLFFSPTLHYENLPMQYTCTEIFFLL